MQFVSLTGVQSLVDVNTARFQAFHGSPLSSLLHFCSLSPQCTVFEKHPTIKVLVPNCSVFSQTNVITYMLRYHHKFPGIMHILEYSGENSSRTYIFYALVSGLAPSTAMTTTVAFAWIAIYKMQS